MVIYMIVETIFYRRAIQERDGFAAFLDLYVSKYGKQSFTVDGETFEVQ